MADCLRVVFVSRVSNYVAALSMGKVRKGDVLRRVKAHFACQAWDFLALKQKLLRGSLMASSLLSIWKVRKGNVLTCETGFRVAGLRLCGTQAKVFFARL